MTHMTLPRFWRHYRELPKEVQKLADKNFELLKSDPHHRSLDFKKVGGKSNFGRYALARTIEHWELRNPMESCGSGSAHMRSMTNC